MHCVTVTYPNKDGGKFNFEYYLQKHMPMVAKFFGHGAEARKGVSTPTGSPAPFVCMATLWVDSMEEYASIMAQHGEQILSDVPNYTNIEPIVQIDEVIFDAAMNPAA